MAAKHDHALASGSEESLAPAPAGNPVADSRELELKLDLPAAALKAVAERLVGHENASRRRAVSLVSGYFDTEQQDLHKAGVTLRIRRQGRKRTQTLKHGERGLGLFDRLEIERRATGDAPTFTDEESEALGRLIAAPPSADALAPVFTTRVKRTVFDVAHGETTIEIALDAASIEAGEHRVEFCELELELRAGAASELFGVARGLLDVAPLRVSVQAKSSRGYALLQNGEPRAFKAQGSPIRRGMTVEQAFLAVAADCVTQFRRNEDLLLAQPTRSAIHRARVALRRLRSGFAIFRPAIADDRAPVLVSELKWLAGALGAARDLDVLIKKQATVAEASDEAASALPERLLASRAKAYGDALDALQSRRALDLMLDLTEWAAVGRWRSDPQTAAARETKIEDFAVEVLDRRLGRLLKRSRGLVKLAPEKRHEARLEAKKLRYAGDFFAALYDGGRSGKRYERFMKRLVGLQDQLGELNDIATAQTLTYGIAQDAGAARDGSSAFAAGVLAGRAESRTAEVVGKAKIRRAKLNKAKPFWR